jgi:hypothetical protein
MSIALGRLKMIKAAKEMQQMSESGHMEIKGEMALSYNKCLEELDKIG